MQFYDLIMLAVMAGCVLFGFWKGLAWQVASLASIIISYFVARNFSGFVAERIGGDPSWTRFLAMFLLFFGCSFAIWIIFGFVRSSIERMHLRMFDKQVGAALGALKGALVCIIITLFSVSLLGEGVCRSICTSVSGNYVARVLAELRGVVPEEIRAYIGPYVDRFNNQMQEHQNEAPSGGNPGLQLPNLPDIFRGAPAPPSTTSQPGWSPPGESTWQGIRESLGQIEPAGNGSAERTWEGQLKRIDWSRTGQAIDDYLNAPGTRK